MKAHPPALKAKGLAAVAAHGSLRKAAAATGIPHTTLADWVRSVPTDDVGEGLDEVPVPKDDYSPREDDETANAANQPELEGALATELPIEAPTSPGFVPDLADPLYLQAFRRYVSGLANGAHPLHAEAAAVAVHPDFEMTDNEHELVVAGVKKILMAEDGWTRLQMATASPPGYVTKIADQYGMDAGKQELLRQHLLELKNEAYVQSINDQLAALGKDAITDISDATVIKALEKSAAEAATAIADNWNVDSASAVSMAWMKALGDDLTYGAARDAITAEMDQWLTDRADWKPDQWSQTEANNAYNQGAEDFVSNNDLAGSANVVPDDAQCDECQDLVAGNPYTLDEMDSTDLDVHPNCVHSWEVSYDESSAEGDVWSGQDTSDEAAA